ncbi:MAG: hypothetical protein MJZ37_04205 [Bacilli bacterium]|nr:hypothetical protein [Bacilli bacterium]
MKPNAKKALIIAGLCADVLLTVLLFVFSIIILAKMPGSKAEIDQSTFLGWFQIDPIRILILDVLPLVVLLGVNLFITIKLFKTSSTKKKVSINDLSDDEKEALKKKLLEEMMNEKKEENK